MKKFLSIISLVLLVLCLLFTFTGCGSETGSNTDKESTAAADKQASKDAKVFDYIDKIEPENTVEEINAIVGFEGKLTDATYNKYTWEISEKTSLTATYYSDNKATIAISCEDSLMQDSNVDFSKYSEIKAALSNTSLTYDEFVEKVGNVQGHLIEKGSISNAYKWVAEDGRYLRATFSNSSNKCTFVSGRI